MKLRGIVWKRSDFRESSRVVTLLTRERGRVRALSKGAHRPNSAVLGKLDLFNRVEASLAGRGMPILGKTRLVHEPRGLRRPRRFLVAQYIAELFEIAFVDSRPDTDLFDLLDGALTLLERVDEALLGTVLAGVELRLLRVLGLLPDLGRCTQCGAVLEAQPRMAPDGGVFCARHAGRGSTAVPRDVLLWLDRLDKTPGKHWSELEPPRDRASTFGILARWLRYGLEAKLASRDAAIRACGERRARIPS